MAMTGEVAIGFTIMMGAKLVNFEPKYKMTKRSLHASIGTYRTDSTRYGNS